MLKIRMQGTWFCIQLKKYFLVNFLRIIMVIYYARRFTMGEIL